jgi:4-amino-4-deoxy-L-arabinose transferase-like glycosyltransferase
MLSNVLKMTDKKILNIFIIFLFVINILQAVFMKLESHEAYYWIYSLYPSFGYYDHPPMIAWIIYIGRSLLEGELGVRFLLPFLFSGSVYFMWLSSERKNILLFILANSSFPVLMASGFYALPDAPLIFFCSLYFYYLKKYLENDSIINALILGAVTAFMVYSKYQGGLVVVLTLLACPKIFQKGSFYLALLTGAAIFLPHIIWQIDNNFPTLQLHVKRHDFDGNGLDFINFLLSQLVCGGIFIILLLLYHLIKDKNNSTYNRILKFNILGVFIFFGIIALKNHVQGQWTVTAFVALSIFSTSVNFSFQKVKKYMLACLIVPCIIFMLIRIAALNKFDADSHLAILNKISMAEEETFKIQEICGSQKIVANSWHNSSKLSFYSGEFVPDFRRNKQFSLIDYYFPANVKYCFVSAYDIPGSIPTTLSNRTVYVLRDADLEHCCK